MLCAGASRQCLSTKAVPVPPPSQLAIINSIMIHPMYTTRANKSDQLQVSAQALAYLRNVLRTVGPVNADMRTAFQFFHAGRLGRRPVRSGYSSDVDSMDEDPDQPDLDIIRGRMANESSVWRRGLDFWSTVGWAFNCSSQHPNRWKYWQVWLEFMLDVLEADWTERSRQDREVHESKGRVGEEPVTARVQAMIVMYMDQQPNGQQVGYKGIMKALFADGGSLSMTTFREVFEKEHRGTKKESNKRKRDDVVDIENGHFGDYFDDDVFSSGASEPPTPEKPRDRRGSSFGSTYPGLAESVELRLRLFGLIAETTAVIREQWDENRLYDDLASSLKVAPLDLFMLFVSQRTNPLDTAMAVTMLKDLFARLLPSSAKDPGKVDKEAEKQGDLTSTMMQHCYSPYCANTIGIEDNAKLSLVVEAAFQLLWNQDQLDVTDEMVAAAEQGVEARLAKCRKKRTGRAKAEADDLYAQEVLQLSGERICLLMGWC